MVKLIDFAVVTIFAREVLEGSLIIGEFRTIILRAGGSLTEEEQNNLLRAINVATVIATIVAVILCAAVAIPLAVLSMDFDSRTSSIIEGVSKLVAAVCILQLSLKLPKWLGIYQSHKTQISDEENEFDLTINSIRFNVAWNIWREVGECGVFLIPFFLNGEEAIAIPLSAVIGCVVGGLAGWGIYYANGRMKNKLSLAIFSAGLLHLLSTGLFTSGCHKFEMVFGSTPVVWQLEGDFWSIDRLPMTIIKPFGYSDTRTVLQMLCFWSWMIFGLLLHYRKWLITKRVRAEHAAKNSPAPSTAEEGADSDCDDEGSGDSLPVIVEEKTAPEMIAYAV
ncbi:iron permease [Seminavis robusta]|uniref:Iron permease n=1 Tax=Seminavis robusta TaxID=568900 RepID=A0A9N8HFJ5_9STRA|nr:iron permease [Seminavis robusta]|eukprot:Sro438_g142960.1 iron permease (336) ;mRNA; f:13227-14234